MYLFVDGERLQDSQLYTVIFFLDSNEYPHFDILVLKGLELVLVRGKLKAIL
jgi:hypothetical protein